MADQVIYTDQLVTITTSRVIVRGTTYALRNITSVRALLTPANTGCAVALIILGVVIAFCGLTGALTNSGAGAVVTGLLFAGAIVVAGVLWMRSLKPTYHLLLASASGETSALSSQDPGYINHLVGCINEAIVRYQ